MDNAPGWRYIGMAVGRPEHERSSGWHGVGHLMPGSAEWDDGSLQTRTTTENSAMQNRQNDNTIANAPRHSCEDSPKLRYSAPTLVHLIGASNTEAKTVPTTMEGFTVIGYGSS